MPKHSYGYIKSKPDHRDYVYRRISKTLPDSVDLRPLASPVRDQGQLGSCTGFAIAVGLREFLENVDKWPFTELSPQFLYYQERVIEGTVGYDSGAEPRDGLKVLASMGCAPESDDPYNVSTFTQEPSSAAVADAKFYPISIYSNLATLTDVQDAHANGLGVVLGFEVYESFENIGADGVMPMPKPNEQDLGGHCVFSVGYKNDTTYPGGGYLIVKNSWGTGWGDKGYFYMPYAYVNPTNVSDMWVAQTSDSPAPVPTPTPTPVPTPGCLPSWVSSILNDFGLLPKGK